MKNIRIIDLIELVENEVPEVEKKIEKIFDWKSSRTIELAKWILGFSATLFITFLIALYKGEISNQGYQ
ncbi:hypothetical protein EHQ27_14050, partial [Leptospira wolffii]